MLVSFYVIRNTSVIYSDLIFGVSSFSTHNIINTSIKLYGTIHGTNLTAAINDVRHDFP